MRKKSVELDVDFIGEQGRSLTAEESAQISAYIQAQKAKQKKKSAMKKRVRNSSLRKKVAA